MPSFSKDPFRDDSKLEDEWFEEDKPTWKPPPHASRPPPSDAVSLGGSETDDQEIEGWFV